MLQRACIAAVLFCSLQSLHADTTWTLKNVTFDDGGTATGTFVLRAFPTRAVIDWNITVAGGNTGAFPPVTYTPANGSSDITPGFKIGPAAGGRSLFLSAGLPESGGSTPINTGQSQECFNCAPFRRVTGGTLEGVPGPGAAENNERWLPIAGSVRGAGGEFFRTNVRIFNQVTVPIIAKISFHPVGRDGVNATAMEFTVAPRSVLELNDVVGQIGGSGLGALRIGSSSAPQVTAQVFTDSRCTAPASGGFFGQFVPSTARESALRRGAIIQLRADSEARSNIGFANPTVLEAIVTIRAFGTNDQQVGSTAQVTVPPFSATSPLNVESLVGPIGQESIWVAFESTQPVIGYGSVVDARTADQYFSPALQD